MHYFNLKEKKALITGGCSGIGLAVAKRYIDAGASVVLADIHNPDDIASKIGAVYINMNVADEKAVSESFAEAERKIGKLDICVNNAGVGDLAGTIKEGDVKVWKKLIDINLFGVLFCLKYGPNHMNNGGSIINTSSVASLHKVPANEPYAATKSAVNSLTRTAAMELGERDIRVNAVCPTNVHTAMTDGSWKDEALLASTFAPLKTPTSVDDIIGIFHFLASRESKQISGQIFAVDGGWTGGISDKAMNAIIGKSNY